MMTMATFKMVLKVMAIFLMTYGAIKAVVFILFDTYEERTMRPSIYVSIFFFAIGLGISGLSNLAPGNVLYGEMEAFLGALNRTLAYPVVPVCLGFSMLCGIVNIVMSIVSGVRFKKRLQGNG